MRIIHCGDLHLDSKMTANLPADKAKERRAELLSSFRRMMNLCDDIEASAVIIAGDLFDTSNILVGTRNVVIEEIQKRPEVTFFYLKGNHDKDNFISSLDTLPENLKLFSDRWTYYTLDQSEGKEVVIGGIELDDFNTNLAPEVLSLYSNNINIITLHGQENEHKTKNRAALIPLKSYRGKNIDYMALGHIHGYKNEELDARGRYCYCGCLEGRGFDECGEKGVVVLDINTTTGNIDTKFVRMSERIIHTVYVDLTDAETLVEVESRITESLETAGVSKNDMVKIVLTGLVDIDFEIDTLYLEQIYKDYCYFAKLTDETGVLVDYTSFAHDASLKGEFVRLVQRQENLSEEEKGEIIKLGIKALSGSKLD